MRNEIRHCYIMPKFHGLSNERSFYDVQIRASSSNNMITDESWKLIEGIKFLCQIWEVVTDWMN